jgi:ribosomal protein S25
MSDLLDRIQRDIRERLGELRPLVSEYEQLRRAMEALEATPAERDPAAAKPGATASPRRQRAPAGTNRDRVLAAVQSNPNATASQIAEASGVKRTVVYGVLRRLTDDGVIEKRGQPETGAGYVVAGVERGDEPASEAPQGGDGVTSDDGAGESDGPD